jgi:hypothetical protein
MEKMRFNGTKNEPVAKITFLEEKSKKKDQISYFVMPPQLLMTLVVLLGMEAMRAASTSLVRFKQPWWPRLSAMAVAKTQD